MSPKPSTLGRRRRTDPTDVILSCIPSGSSSEFAEFYGREHEGQIRRAYLLLGGAAAAHDIVAEAFMAVLTRWADIDEPGADSSPLTAATPIST